MTFIKGTFTVISEISYFILCAIINVVLDIMLEFRCISILKQAAKQVGKSATQHQLYATAYDLHTRLLNEKYDRAIARVDKYTRKGNSPEYLRSKVLIVHNKVLKKIAKRYHQ